MNAHNTSSWMTSKLFRVLVLVAGVMLLVVYGMTLIVVGVNLPDSWFGLILVIVGLVGAIASFRYYRSQRRSLLIAVAAAVLLTVAWLGVTLVFGRKIDERRLKSTGMHGAPSFQRKIPQRS
jgi:membrane-bound ClpP family serine protease